MQMRPKAREDAKYDTRMQQIINSQQLIEHSGTS